MLRLICAFVVRIWHEQVFSWCGSNNCGEGAFIGINMVVCFYVFRLFPLSSYSGNHRRQYKLHINIAQYVNQTNINCTLCLKVIKTSFTKSFITQTYNIYLHTHPRYSLLCPLTGSHWCRRDTSLFAWYLRNRLPDFNQICMDITLGHVEELIRFCWTWPDFQGHCRT